MHLQYTSWLPVPPNQHALSVSQRCSMALHYSLHPWCLWLWLYPRERLSDIRLRKQIPCPQKSVVSMWRKVTSLEKRWTCNNNVTLWLSAQENALFTCSTPEKCHCTGLHPWSDRECGVRAAISVKPGTLWLVDIRQWLPEGHTLEHVFHVVGGNENIFYIFSYWSNYALFVAAGLTAAWQFHLSSAQQLRSH